METISALLAFSAGNSPVSGEFPSQRPVTRSFDVFFDLCPKKRLGKQLWGWWFETPSGSLWRYCNETLFSRGLHYRLQQTHVIDVPIFLRVTSQACFQHNDCPITREVILRQVVITPNNFRQFWEAVVELK